MSEASSIASEQQASKYKAKMKLMRRKMKEKEKDVDEKVHLIEVCIVTVYMWYKSM